MFDLTAIDQTWASHLYVVGDIHGRLDLVTDICRAIEKDTLKIRARDPVVVFLGDYIDKGPNSREVVDFLCRLPNRGSLKYLFLRGNHEDRLLKFLAHPELHGEAWLAHGGREAFASYGIRTEAFGPKPNWAKLHSAFRSRLPIDHENFLVNTRLAVAWRSFLVVHAGLNPAASLAEQDPHDLMWIRESFLRSSVDWGLRVIHGHVPVATPEFHSNRIAIDTGAYSTGILTCLVLNGDSIRILQSTGRPALTS